MEAREKLSSISNGLKVLQDGRAGRASRVKKLTYKLNLTNFNFAVQPHPQKTCWPRKFPVLQYCEHKHAPYHSRPALLAPNSVTDFSQSHATIIMPKNRSLLDMYPSRNAACKHRLSSTLCLALESWLLSISCAHGTLSYQQPPINLSEQKETYTTILLSTAHSSNKRYWTGQTARLR